MRPLLPDGQKQITSKNDAHRTWICIGTRHGESLSWACLAISEDTDLDSRGSLHPKIICARVDQLPMLEMVIPTFIGILII